MNRPQRKARVLAHQTEVFADLDALMVAVREAVTRLVEAHAAAKRAQNEVVLANRIVSDSTLIGDETCSDCLGTGVDHGEKCNLCRGKSVAA